MNTFNNNGIMIAEQEISFENLELAVFEPVKFHHKTPTINCNKVKGIINISNCAVTALALTDENYIRVLKDKKNNRLFLQCSGYKQDDYFHIKKSKNDYLYFRINKKSPIDTGRYLINLEPLRINDKERKLQLLYEITKIEKK